MAISVYRTQMAFEGDGGESAVATFIGRKNRILRLYVCVYGRCHGLDERITVLFTTRNSVKFALVSEADLMDKER